MTWQWFDVVGAVFAVEATLGTAVVGGPVQLFGAPWWCMWSQAPNQSWRAQALRALDSGQAIVEVARAFPAREIGRA